MVLGLGGLGNGWRAAARVWGAPDLPGEALSFAAGSVWFLWIVLYGWKWAMSREEAVAELRHPIQAFFIALVPVATMIAATAVAPYIPTVAWAMFVLGSASQVGFSAWVMGELWQGGRHTDATTPTLYMPTVGGCFVSAIASGSFGYPNAGLLFFGAGFLSLVVLESIVLHRLMIHTLPVSLRATMGLHLATPAVGSVAYLAVTEGPPDRFVQMLFGYALLQALVMLRLVPWLRQQPFSPAAWAYTFGVSALPLAALRFVERGQTGPISFLATPLFISANLIIGWIALRTVRLAFTGKLLPRDDLGRAKEIRTGSRG
jgi:tellurite resistance protein